MEFKSRVDTSEYQKKMKDLKVALPIKAAFVAELIAREVVEHARSLTDETKPGIRDNDGPRKKHPGNWADIRGQLAASIKARVEREGITAKAIVEATAEYAEALDAKTGYDVLGGADKIGRKAIKKHGPKIFQ